MFTLKIRTGRNRIVSHQRTAIVPPIDWVGKSGYRIMLKPLSSPASSSPAFCCVPAFLGRHLLEAFSFEGEREPASGRHYACSGGEPRSESSSNCSDQMTPTPRKIRSTPGAGRGQLDSLILRAVPAGTGADCSARLAGIESNRGLGQPLLMTGYSSCFNYTSQRFEQKW